MTAKLPLIAQSKFATVTGTIKNSKQNYLLIEKLGQPSNSKDTIKLSLDGKFSYQTNDLESIQPYKLIYGSRLNLSDTPTVLKKVNSSTIDKIDLMLDKGFALKLSIDAIGNPSSNNKIQGKGANASIYYNKKIALNQAFQSNYSRILKTNKDTFSYYVDQLQLNNIELIKTILKPNNDVPAAYIDKESNTLKYNIARLKTFFATSQINRYKNDSIVAVFDSKYFNFLKDVPFDHPTEKAVTTPYSFFLNTYIDYSLAKNNKGEKAEGKELFTQKYDLYKTLFKSEQLRDEQMFDLLYQFNGSAKENWYATAIHEFSSTAKNDSLKGAINTIFTIRQKMMKGKPAYDFKVVDSEGKTHSLHEFKGKYVYIDTWATWCKPCLQEIPALQKMIEHFKGKNIEFLSVSIDKDSTIWQRYITKKALSGNQFWSGEVTNTDYGKEFIIQDIPRFMLIDAQGNFIDPIAPRPSSTDLQNWLDTRLNKKGRLNNFLNNSNLF